MVLPRAALNHDFLMQAMLGIAAAHLADVSPYGKSAFRNAASFHRVLDMELAVPAFIQTSPGN